jgi:hypothetical protein
MVWRGTATQEQCQLAIYFCWGMSTTKCKIKLPYSSTTISETNTGILSHFKDTLMPTHIFLKTYITKNL